MFLFFLCDVSASFFSFCFFVFLSVSSFVCLFSFVFLSVFVFRFFCPGVGLPSRVRAGHQVLEATTVGDARPSGVRSGARHARPGAASGEGQNNKRDNELGER